jgi:hypothetical protein
MRPRFVLYGEVSDNCLVFTEHHHYWALNVVLVSLPAFLVVLAETLSISNMRAGTFETISTLVFLALCAIATALLLGTVRRLTLSSDAARIDLVVFGQVIETYQADGRDVTIYKQPVLVFGSPFAFRGVADRLRVRLADERFCIAVHTSDELDQQIQSIELVTQHRVVLGPPEKYRF